MASTRVISSLLAARRPGAAAASRGLASAAALAENEVALNILAAPVTAADLGSKTPAGVEGVGIVTAVGSGVKGFAINDWVVPTSGGVGTFKTTTKAKEAELAKVPSDIPVEYAALVGTAVTALKLLAGVKEGDYIIQTDADSSVGLAIVQIARERGVGTINIIADAMGYQEKAGLVKDLGADVVVTDTYAQSNPGFAKILSELPKAKMGFAAGEAGAALLGKSGVKVTSYGGVSELKKASAGEIAEAAELFRSGALKLWVERHPFSDLPFALAEAQEPYKTRKVVLVNEVPTPKVDLGKLQTEFENAFRKLKA